MRRVLSALEAFVKPKQQLPLTRGAHQKYSKMTWHDAELLMFEQRAKAKSAEAARLKSMMKMAQSRSESRVLDINTFTPSAPRVPAVERTGSGGSCEELGSLESLLEDGDDDFEGDSHQEVDEEESYFGGVPNASNLDELSFGSATRYDKEGPDTEFGENEAKSLVEDTEIQGNNEGNEEIPGSKEAEVKVVKKKQRPRSSYGQRLLHTSVHFINNHPVLNSAPPNSLKTPTCVESSSPSLTSLTKGQKPVHAKLVLRVTRPKTDPNKLYKRYGQSVAGITDGTASPQPPKTEVVDQSVTLLGTKVGESKSGRAASLGASGIYQVHRTKCQIPGPHTNDIHNTYSLTKGPNSTLRSLMGGPPVPRDVFLHIHHTSAWYHVPGRYPTISSPYPRKRSQKRITYSSRRHSPEGGPASYQDETAGMDRSSADDQASQNSWNSGRNRIPVGAGFGNIISDWMT